MLQKRVIPVLLLRNKGLVKTVKFDKHKYIGDPINAIKIFNDKEVDELVFLDIDASKQGRDPDFKTIADIASECFMPLGYGGGISTIDHLRELFAIGVEKAIINSNILSDLELIKRGSEMFGGQSVVASIDVKKNTWGKHHVYSHKSKSTLNQDVVAFAQEVEKAGAGEIVLNAVDRDGTMSGYDTKLIEKVSSAINIPLVACGGAGTISDFNLASEAGASAMAAGSLFVYHGPHKAVLINYPSQSELKKVIQ